MSSKRRRGSKRGSKRSSHGSENDGAVLDGLGENEWDQAEPADSVDHINQKPRENRVSVFKAGKEEGSVRGRTRSSQRVTASKHSGSSRRAQKQNPQLSSTQTTSTSFMDSGSHSVSVLSSLTSGAEAKTESTQDHKLSSEAKEHPSANASTPKEEHSSTANGKSASQHSLPLGTRPIAAFQSSPAHGPKAIVLGIRQLPFPAPPTSTTSEKSSGDQASVTGTTSGISSASKRKGTSSGASGKKDPKRQYVSPAELDVSIEEHQAQQGQESGTGADQSTNLTSTKVSESSFQSSSQSTPGTEKSSLATSEGNTSDGSTTGASTSVTTDEYGRKIKKSKRKKKNTRCSAQSGLTISSGYTGQSSYGDQDSISSSTCEPAALRFSREHGEIKVDLNRPAVQDPSANYMKYIEDITSVIQEVLEEFSDKLEVVDGEAFMPKVNVNVKYPADTYYASFPIDRQRDQRGGTVSGFGDCSRDSPCDKCVRKVSQSSYEDTSEPGTSSPTK